MQSVSESARHSYAKSSINGYPLASGTPIVGNTDNIQKLQDICKKEEIWLHLEGYVLHCFIANSSQFIIYHRFHTPGAEWFYYILIMYIGLSRHSAYYDCVQPLQFIWTNVLKLFGKPIPLQYKYMYSIYSSGTTCLPWRCTLSRQRSCRLKLVTVWHLT